MCVVSMIGDHYRDRWVPPSPLPWRGPTIVTIPDPNGPTKAEFDALKRQVEEMKDLLKRAKAYDESNGEPDCEMEEKIELLRKIAEAVGVDLDEIFGDQRGDPGNYTIVTGEVRTVTSGSSNDLSLSTESIGGTPDF